MAVMATPRPSIFIGSSQEGLDVARDVESLLSEEAVCRIWTNNVFRPGEHTLEALINSLPLYDFAIMVLSGDDLLSQRQEERLSARDNVIFELGLFMGKIGRLRTFIIKEDNINLILPSDLSGITTLFYKKSPEHGNLVSPACTKIINSLRTLGPFEGKAGINLAKATGEIENASSLVTEMTKRLIKSRILEMKIVEHMVPAASRHEVQQDRNDLQAILDGRE